jgi:hypothetical protein
MRIQDGDDEFMDFVFEMPDEECLVEEFNDPSTDPM